MCDKHYAGRHCVRRPLSRDRPHGDLQFPPGTSPPTCESGFHSPLVRWHSHHVRGHRVHVRVIIDRRRTGENGRKLTGSEPRNPETRLLTYSFQNADRPARPTVHNPRLYLNVFFSNLLRRNHSMIDLAPFVHTRVHSFVLNRFFARPHMKYRRTVYTFGTDMVFISNHQNVSNTIYIRPVRVDCRGSIYIRLFFTYNTDYIQ